MTERSMDSIVLMNSLSNFWLKYLKWVIINLIRSMGRRIWLMVKSVCGKECKENASVLCTVIRINFVKLRA